MGQLFAAIGRQPVDPRLPVVGRESPLAVDPAIQFKPLQGGLERAFLDNDLFSRRLLYALHDRVAMRIAPCERLEDEHVERPWKRIVLLTFASHTKNS